MSRIAMCACGEPLVMTFIYRGKEFYCVQCGATYGFLGPCGAESTQTLEARMEELNATFLRLAAGIMGDGGRRGDCTICAAKHEHHIMHATAVEIDADKAARRRLLDHIVSVREAGR